VSLGGGAVVVVVVVGALVDVVGATVVDVAGGFAFVVGVRGDVTGGTDLAVVVTGGTTVVDTGTVVVVASRTVVGVVVAGGTVVTAVGGVPAPTGTVRRVVLVGAVVVVIEKLSGWVAKEPALVAQTSQVTSTQSTVVSLTVSMRTTVIVPSNVAPSTMVKTV
jgi:hypothetical protein